MKRLFILFSFSCLLFTASGLAQSLISLIEKEPMPETTLIEEPTTTITFEKIEFDFGEVDQGEKVRHTYKFTNTGDIPLIISNAKGSCGCTIPSWPKDPIFPGETGTMEVEFNTKGKKGKQSKRVTITANTDPAITFLTIKGMVNVPETDAIEREDITETAPAANNNTTEEAHKDCIAVYPNPTSDVLKLELKDHAEKSALIEIYNDVGQRIDSKQIDQLPLEAVTFDVRRYTPGIYTVMIQVEKGKPFSRCFVVQN